MTSDPPQCKQKHKSNLLEYHIFEGGSIVRISRHWAYQVLISEVQGCLVGISAQCLGSAKEISYEQQGDKGTRERMHTDEFGMDSADCDTPRYSGEQSKLSQVFFERHCKRLTVTSQSPCPRMMRCPEGVTWPTHLYPNSNTYLHTPFWDQV